MITFDIDARGLTRSRFAISRLAELGNALEVLAHPDRAPYARRWARRVRGSLDRSSIAVLLALVEHDSWYVPDFLVPHPGRYEPSLDDELAAVVGTGSDQVAFQLRMAFQLGALPSVARERYRGAPGHDPRALLPREVARVLDDGGEDALIACVADQLRRAWKIVLADLWEPVRRVLDGDVRHHATLASRTGLAEILRDVNGGLEWTGTQVKLEHPYDLDVGEISELVLAPSVFLPRAAVWLGRQGRVLVGYPARGRGQVWSLPVSSAGPIDLLGPRRSALLADLRTPRSTSELAVRHRLSPATISYHIGRMHRAGLLSRHQAGRVVLYERTERAESLLGALDGSESS